MLAVSNGTMWLLSTSGAARFLLPRMDACEPWVPLAVPATECPRFSKGFLDEGAKAEEPADF
jgi:hypothetical protein